MLRGFTEADLEPVIRACRVRVYPRYSAIVRSASQGKACYMLHHGVAAALRQRGGCVLAACWRRGDGTAAWRQRAGGVAAARSEAFDDAVFQAWYGLGAAMAMILTAPIPAMNSRVALYNSTTCFASAPLPCFPSPGASFVAPPPPLTWLWISEGSIPAPSRRPCHTLNNEHTLSICLSNLLIKKSS